MPRLLKQLQKEPDLVQKYAAAFAKEPVLKEVGSLTSILSKSSFFLNECVILSNMRLLMLDAWEVGFNFITAHSRGLFDSRSEATIKDVERNHEACFFWLCGFCIHDLL